MDISKLGAFLFFVLACLCLGACHHINIAKEIVAEPPAIQFGYSVGFIISSAISALLFGVLK